MDYYQVKNDVLALANQREAEITRRIDTLQESGEVAEYAAAAARRSTYDDAAMRQSDGWQKAMAQLITPLEYDRHIAYEKAAYDLLGEYAGLYLAIAEGLAPIDDWPTAKLNAEGWQPAFVA